MSESTRTRSRSSMIGIGTCLKCCSSTAAKFDRRQPLYPPQRLHHVDAAVENFGRGSTAIKTPLRFLLSSEAHLYRWDLTWVN